MLVIGPSAMMPGKYRIRERELAEHLAAFYEVYYLSWKVPERHTLSSRARALWHDFVRDLNIRPEGAIHIAELSMLRRPFFAALWYNTMQLSALIRYLNLDIVLNGSNFLYLFPSNGAIYCYDFRDVPVTESESWWFRTVVPLLLRRETRKAHLVTAVSRRLSEYLERLYGVDVWYLPNGMYLSAFCSVSEAEIDAARRRYGLQGKFVIGYIGNFGKWAGLDFAVQVFEEFQRDINNAALFIVGPGEEVERCRKIYASEDIVFTGGIDRVDVYRYFRCMDVGILSSPLAGFRDYSFPIKVIEYSAAKKMVVSTPVDELKRINLPNVYFAEYGSVEQWVDALKRAKEHAWQPAWDEVIRAYDWGKICEGLKERLERA